MKIPGLIFTEQARKPCLKGNCGKQSFRQNDFSATMGPQDRHPLPQDTAPRHQVAFLGGQDSCWPRLQPVLRTPLPPTLP